MCGETFPQKCLVKSRKLCAFLYFLFFLMFGIYHVKVFFCFYAKYIFVGCCRFLKDLRWSS